VVFGGLVDYLVVWVLKGIFSNIDTFSYVAAAVLTGFYLPIGVLSWSVETFGITTYFALVAPAICALAFSGYVQSMDQKKLAEYENPLVFRLYSKFQQLDSEHTAAQLAGPDIQQIVRAWVQIAAAGSRPAVQPPMTRDEIRDIIEESHRGGAVVWALYDWRGAREWREALLLDIAGRNHVYVEFRSDYREVELSFEQIARWSAEPPPLPQSESRDSLVTRLQDTYDLNRYDSYPRLDRYDSFDSIPASPRLMGSAGEAPLLDSQHEPEPSAASMSEAEKENAEAEAKAQAEQASVLVLLEEFMPSSSIAEREQVAEILKAETSDFFLNEGSPFGLCALEAAGDPKSLRAITQMFKKYCEGYKSASHQNDSRVFTPTSLENLTVAKLGFSPLDKDQYKEMISRDLTERRRLMGAPAFIKGAFLTKQAFVDQVSAHSAKFLQISSQKFSLQSIFVYLMLLTDAIQFAALPAECMESVIPSTQPLLLLAPPSDHNFGLTLLLLAMVAPIALLCLTPIVKKIQQRIVFVQLHRRISIAFVIEVLRVFGYILYMPIAKILASKAIDTPFGVDFALAFVSLVLYHAASSSLFPAVHHAAESATIKESPGFLMMVYNAKLVFVMGALVLGSQALAWLILCCLVLAVLLQQAVWWQCEICRLTSIGLGLWCCVVSAVVLEHKDDAHWSDRLLLGGWAAGLAFIALAWLYELLLLDPEVHQAEQMHHANVVPTLMWSQEEIKAAEQLDLASLIDLEDSKVQEVAEKLEVQPNVARSLLNHFAWDEYALITSFKEDPARTLVLVKLDPRVFAPTVTAGVMGKLDRKSTVVNFLRRADSNERKQRELIGDVPLCHICYCEPEEPIFTCSSGHQFCSAPCIETYLVSKIVEADIVSLVCPAMECNELIPHDYVRGVLQSNADSIDYGGRLHTREELLDKFNRFESRAFVRANPNLRECPNCSKTVKREDSSTMNVQCGACKKEFCWNCLKSAHYPATCESLKQFAENEILTASDDPTAAIIAAGCRKCPQCESMIFKDEGCKHMTCSVCRHEWCWECRQPWKMDGTGGKGVHTDYFSCNQEAYVDMEELKQQDLRDAYDQALTEKDRWLRERAAVHVGVVRAIDGPLLSGLKVTSSLQSETDLKQSFLNASWRLHCSCAEMYYGEGEGDWIAEVWQQIGRAEGVLFTMAERMALETPDFGVKQDSPRRKQDYMTPGVLQYLSKLDAVSCEIPQPADDPSESCFTPRMSRRDSYGSYDEHVVPTMNTDSYDTGGLDGAPAEELAPAGGGGSKKPCPDMIGAPKAGQTAHKLNRTENTPVEFQFTLKGVSLQATECVVYLKYDQYQIGDYLDERRYNQSSIVYNAYYHADSENGTMPLKVLVGTAYNSFKSIEYSIEWMHTPDVTQLEAFDAITQRDASMASIYKGPPSKLLIPLTGLQSGSIVGVKFACRMAPFEISGIDFHGSLLWPSSPLEVADFTRNATVYTAYLRNALYIGAPVVSRDNFSNIKRNDRGHFVGWFSGSPPMLIWWPEQQVANFVEPSQIALSAVADSCWLCASCGAENKFIDMTSINTCCGCKQSRPLPSTLGSASRKNITQESVDRLLALFQQPKISDTNLKKLQIEM
jgi:hypothetical protein